MAIGSIIRSIAAERHTVIGQRRNNSAGRLAATLQRPDGTARSSARDSKRAPRIAEIEAGRKRATGLSLEVWRPSPMPAAIEEQPRTGEAPAAAVIASEIVKYQVVAEVEAAVRSVERAAGEVARAQARRADRRALAVAAHAAVAHEEEEEDDADDLAKVRNGKQRRT